MKKIRDYDGRVLLSFLPKKTIRVMKLTLLLTMVAVIQLWATETYSQLTHLTLKLDDVTISDALKEIENQSEFFFLYSPKLIDVERKVNIDAKDETIKDILTSIFDEKVKFAAYDRQIVITPIEQSEVLSELQQQKQITGTVTDKNGPIPGANVVVTGTTTGTVTDINGKYSLAVPQEAQSLTITFIGMEPQKIIIGTLTQIDVTMTESAVGLDEVVVIGYGSIKKSDLTGSVASVKGDLINAFPSATIDKALQGRVSGVQVVQNTGAPGASIQILIRGANSIRGDNSPLWIVDGFPGGIFDATDIESIEVLKDASATAIYGSRGANGVVLVTTRHGKAGSTKVNYEGSFGIQTLRKKLDLMDAKEYMLFNNIQQLNDSGSEYFTQDQINNAGKGIDWQDKMFRPAPIKHHSLNVSGGNEITQFFISGSYLDQKGILMNNDGYQRAILRAKVNHDISKKFSIAYNASLGRIDNASMDITGQGRGASLFSSITCAPPTLTPYNDDGSYRLFKVAYPFISDGQINPVMYVEERSNKYYENNVNASLAFTYKPIDGLLIRISGNVSNVDSRRDNYTRSTYIGSTGDASISTGQSLSLNSENLVTYHKTINEDHDFTITGAGTYDQNVYTSLGASGSGFLSDNYQTYNIGAAAIADIPSSSYSKWALLSYLGRLNYSYKSKYLVTASFRSDGSSRYSEGNKWGYFPSGALAWRISEEDFMKNAAFISNLKFRSGYGETGSTAISPYTTLSMLSTGKTVFDKTLYNYYAPSSTYPGNLKWETTAQTDIGMDIAFFNNRISLTADYYIKNTRNLLNTVQLATSTGYSTTVKNVGKIQNKGLELQLDAIILDRTVKWDISTNASFNRNKVVKLYDGQDITGSVFGINIMIDYINLLREGEPLGIFYGYLEDGYDENGKIKYLDRNNDGSISPLDKTIIGDPNPDLLFNFKSNLSYKNLEFSFFIQSSLGNDIYSLSMAAQNYDYAFGSNAFKEVLNDHWTPETPNAKYPKLSISSSSLNVSDRFVYDGSYIRLKDVQLSYNIPLKKIGIQWINKGQIYVSAQNLLTITSYPWIDPDVNVRGGGSSVNQGIDLFSYPNSKCITFGARIEF